MKFMFSGRPGKSKFFFSTVFVLLVACSGIAHASATLLLEEPYGKLGFFTATGHAAVYLSGVCAESPVVLRHCKPGETGIVISRYDGVGHYDWVAIPLIPYLYAVENPQDVPLFADSKMTAFLRDRYRRKHLEQIAPDKEDGATPGGNWYELVGSSYDRTIYGFEIKTTPEQDEALIRKLNASENVSHFRTVSRNCADFAKDILNFYYPHSVRRSVVADIGITTPKQITKRLIKYSARHPQVELSRIVIPQVPGSMPRSSTVHNVVESFFTSKKYIVPSAIMSPIFAGCVAAVYVGTGGAHFEPARDAMVFVMGGAPEPPLDREDRRAYQEELKHMLAGTYPDKNVERLWGKRQSKAEHAVDRHGRPVLEFKDGDQVVQIGASAGNILNGHAPPQLVQQLLAARLQSELHSRSPHGLTESQVERDWQLLEKSMGENDLSVARVSSRSESTRGNQQ